LGFSCTTAGDAVLLAAGAKEFGCDAIMLAALPSQRLA
jgi:hypothetical protein